VAIDHRGCRYRDLLGPTVSLDEEYGLAAVWVKAGRWMVRSTRVTGRREDMMLEFDILLLEGSVVWFRIDELRQVGMGVWCVLQEESMVV